MGWSRQELKIVAMFSCVYERKDGSRALDFSTTQTFIAAVPSLEYGREGSSENDRGKDVIQSTVTGMDALKSLPRHARQW